MIKLINKVLDKLNLQIVKQDKKAEWGNIIYSTGYKNAVLNSVGTGEIPEKDLPLVFDMEAPKEHYKYFVDCYMNGFDDGKQAINTARNLLIKFI